MLVSVSADAVLSMAETKSWIAVKGKWQCKREEGKDNEKCEVEQGAGAEDMKGRLRLRKWWALKRYQVSSHTH